MSSTVFLPASQTRLVTIIAHVDHGKTTLADNLIEHNGIISERLAGTLRYLDSDPEEQRRGITIRTSAIGLRHCHGAPPGKRKKNLADETMETYVIHLLDSPGHTDFSFEVSSALVACDSCLLVLDAVEGMAPRTHQVLREAHVHRLVPVLVVNKIDRLCTDLGLTCTEAYLRIRNLLETVNAAASAMLVSAAQERGTISDEEEALWTFDPAKNNVIFASALLGWAFTAQSLARSLFRQSIIPIKPILLKQYLFTDAKHMNEKVLKWKITDDSLPIFAEYGLQPLWNIHETVAANVDKTTGKTQMAGLESIIAILQTGATGSSPHPVTSMDSLKQLLKQTGASTEVEVLRALLRRYRPLAETVLDVVCEYCVSPASAVATVRSDILTLQAIPKEHGEDTHVLEMWNRIQKSVLACDENPDSPTVAHVCKFMSTNRIHIRDPDLPDEPPNLILGLARVLSGVLRTGCSYYLYGPKHAGPAVGELLQRSVRLYLLMGSSFVRVESVPAGHICAIQNLEGIAFKSVTLCDSTSAMPLQGFIGSSLLRPLVKVSIEPENAADVDILERGLMKLSLADAAVEVTATARGERILACLGEIHLEQSILELENLYCEKKGIKLRISDPIVDFGETTVWFDNETEGFSAFLENTSEPPLRQMSIPPYCEEEGIEYAYRGRSRAIVSGRCAAICLRVVPLSPDIYNCLKTGNTVEHVTPELLKLGNALGLPTPESGSQDSLLLLLKQLQNLVCYIHSNGNVLVESPGMRAGSCIKGILSAVGEVLVPRKKEKGNKNEVIRCMDKDCPGDPNLVELECEDIREMIKRTISNNETTANGMNATFTSPLDRAACHVWNENMKVSAIAGFQLAVRSGWICEEPVRNVMVVLEGVEIALAETTTHELGFAPIKPLSGGMVVSALRVGVRSALLSRPARLMEGHLRLTLHSSLTGLGSLYSVLSKRRGKVVDDSMVDGTDLLLITALIPQAESFGLGPELLRKTSGEVTVPELTFDHWALLDEDPFWIPTSLEEREDFGELQQSGDSSTGFSNHALRYIRKVRERKGLVVDSSRTVIAAEKQRTLKK